MLKERSLISLTILSLLFSCATPVNLDNSKINRNNVSSAVIINKPISGFVDFPKLTSSPTNKVENVLSTKATVTDIGTNATVSLIYPSDYSDSLKRNQTIASGVTNSSGAFTINPNFTANTGDIFVLEANRRIGATGNALMSVRTFIKWNGSSWSSITTGGVAINSKTTALVAMSGLLSPSVSSDDTIGTITSGNPTDIKHNGTGAVIINAASVTSAADLVINALSKNQDPIQYLAYSNGKFMLKDPDDIYNPMTTFAGVGTIFTGDSLQATEAKLNPNGIAKDSLGNIYVTDLSNNTVRKISPTGIITTFAGTARIGNTINSTNATLTQLYSPQGIVVDSSNNVYIADTNNYGILKINPAGNSVTRFAGNGTGISGSGLNSTSATNTQLYYPNALAIDSSGNIYIVDSYNYRVLKINPAGNSVTRFAGTGASGSTINSTNASLTQLNYPSSITIDSSNNVYIADGNYRVLKINPAGNSVSVFAGTGTQGSTINSTSATNTQLSSVNSLLTDSSNNVYISDGNNRLLKVNSSGNSVSVFAGTGTQGGTINSTSATNTQFGAIGALLIDSSNNFYITDVNRVLKTNLSGSSVSVFAGCGVNDNVQGTLTYIKNPGQIAKDSQGNIYVADSDSNNNRIRKISSSGIASTFAGAGWYYGSTINSTNANLTELSTPKGVAVDSLDNVYISDYSHNRILKVNSAGTNVSLFAGTGTLVSTNATQTQLYNPSELSIDSSGNVYISDTGNHRILKINSSGDSVTRFAGTGSAGSTINSTSATNTQLNSPNSTYIDGSNNVYISDTGNHRVLKINSSGDSVTRFAGTGSQGSTINSTSSSLTQLQNPKELAMDASGNIYISDSNKRIIKTNSAGTSVSLYAGTGAIGFSNDGLSAEYSSFNIPSGLLIDSGFMYISDSNGYIKKIEMTDKFSP